MTTSYDSTSTSSHSPNNNGSGMGFWKILGIVVVALIAPAIIGPVLKGLFWIGLFALASPFDASWVLIGAITLTGLAQGAEGDIGAILTSRKFDLAHYSFIYSFIIAAMGAAAAVGSLVLSYLLHRTDSYNEFLVLAGIATLFGVVCFYFIGRHGRSGLSERRQPAPPSP